MYSSVQYTGLDKTRQDKTSPKIIRQFGEVKKPQGHHGKRLRLMSEDSSSRNRALRVGMADARLTLLIIVAKKKRGGHHVVRRKQIPLFFSR